MFDSLLVDNYRLMQLISGATNIYILLSFLLLSHDNTLSFHSAATISSPFFPSWFPWQEAKGDAEFFDRVGQEVQSEMRRERVSGERKISESQMV